MFDPVFGQDSAVARFVSAELFGHPEGFENFKAIGFGQPFVAGVVYHNWQPAAGVIELSAASTRRDWVTRGNLRTIFDYPFGQMGCQLCVARISENNARTRRIWRALGADEFIIPRLRGRFESEIIATLTDEAWRNFIGD